MIIYGSTDREPGPERYGRLRVQTDDLTPAAWLTERRPGHGAFGTVAGVSAPGFPAYARVLHPAHLDEQPVRWETVGAAYRRKPSGGTCWHDLIGVTRDESYGDVYLPGVWDEGPGEGPTPPDVARALIAVLARHTGTPDRCWFALWEGYGRWEWGGVPRFETPHRDKVLMAGALADADSPESLDPFAELPDLWWPEDRAWCVGGDTDLKSTYVGGSEALIADLVADPALEAHRVADTDPVD
ncbi:hypothetical protein LG634_11085 [Streptomyces bambusae]|uniref:hypothetical protein n=1 Tax=Streptomyces bambusae TaxID=1550616 RepID=UPI001CFE939E|nr:hypothetical protein [Streptomyces bambusae]MCB5165373.1 hypothetical protein [Streptomyces bambusae]